MFCSKCGTQLNDDAVFCSACGNAVAQPQTAPAEQTPVESPVTPVEQTPVKETPASPAVNALPNGLVTIPKLSELVVFGVSVLMFIFMFLPWFKYGFEFFGTGYYEHFSIFASSMFELSALIGIAKIFGIINIIVFVVYALLRFIDITKLVPAIPAGIDLKKYSAYAFGGIYALEWVLTLIGIIATEYVGISVCLIFALVFAAAFIVATVKPDIVDNLFKNVKK